jgi:hypothetical protein
MPRLENGLRFLVLISINMNDIPQKQNEYRQIELLLAQRRLYSKAKTYFTWRLSLALMFAIVGPIVTSLNNNLGVYVGIIAIAYLLINNLVLEKLESSIKTNAAKIQELFDTYLFALPWNDYVVGKKPDTEIIAEILGPLQARDFTDLKDWYAVDAGKIDLELARFICQRSNVWWDTNLRKLYINLLVFVLVIVIGVVVIASVVVNLTVAKLIVGIILPALPFVEVAMMQIKDNWESACVTTELKGNIDTEIDKRVNGEAVQNSASVARVFQDQIWRHRSKCPMVFDWVHKISKTRHENQMQFSVKAKVEEYLVKNGRG